MDECLGTTSCKILRTKAYHNPSQGLIGSGYEEDQMYITRSILMEELKLSRPEKGLIRDINVAGEKWLLSLTSLCQQRNWSHHDRSQGPIRDMNQTGRRKYTISPVPVEVLVPFMMTQFELCNLADGDKKISSISNGRPIMKTWAWGGFRITRDGKSITTKMTRRRLIFLACGYRVRIDARKGQGWKI